MKIVKDKDLIWDVDDYEVVLVGTSIYNQMGGGFQSKIRFKFPIVEEINNKTKFADQSKLGTRITVEGTEPVVSLMYICNYPRPNKDSVDYEALERCLKTANAEFKGKKVCTTVLGASEFDGSGDYDKCLKLIEDNTKDLYITVYDYKQKKRGVEQEECRKYLMSLKYTDKEKYEKLKSVYNSYLQKLYLA